MSTELNVYETFPYAESHPAFLEAVGILFGLRPTKHDQCRILELGCGTGGNLIPHAYYLPESRFLGIDLSQENIRHGSHLIKKAGLENIELIQGDILELDSSLGSFDYIIAHGVFSWVPESVRQHLLTLFKDLLSPTGIGYISFNCKPGWSRRRILRDILINATSHCKTDRERLTAAEAVLNRLETGYTGSTDPLAEHLIRDIEHVRQAHPSYVLQEYLNPYNTAYFLGEFVDQLNHHGLQYLSDTALNSGSPEAFGLAFEQATTGIEASDDIEQWVDFLRLREFRQALVVHDDVQIESDLDLEVFCRMGLLIDASAVGKAKGSDTDILAGLTHPLSKAAVKRLIQEFPNALSLNTLMDSTDTAAADEVFYGEMFGLLLEEKLILRPGDMTFNKPGLKRPKATALARQQAELDWGHVATIHHSLLTLDEFSNCVLSHCDGRNTVAEIANKIQSANHAKKASSNRNDVTRNVERLVRVFADHGVLV